MPDPVEAPVRPQTGELAPRRLATLTALMERHALDALVLTSFDNVRYATGVPTPDYAEGRHDGFAAVVSRDGEGWFFSSWMDQVEPPERDRPDADTLADLAGGGVAPYVVEARPLPALSSPAATAPRVASILGRKLRELRAARIGVDSLPFSTHGELLRLVPGLETTPIAFELQAARAIKDPAEVALMSANAAALDRVFAVVMSAIAAGETLTECRGRAAHAMYANGAEAISHLFAGHGSPTELRGPGDAASDRVPPGATAWVDMGFYGAEGYGTDAARTAVCGQASGSLRDGFARIHDAYLRCLDRLRPGRPVSSFEADVREIVAGVGQGDYRLPCGHGIGLRVGEHPLLAPAAMRVGDATIEPGMVVCVELHLQHDGHPISLEDMLLITPTGTRALTNAPHQLEGWL